MTSRWTNWAGLSAAVPLLLLAGCADEQRPAVEQTVAAFISDLAAGDSQAGCALLAPATRDALEYQSNQSCAVALEQLSLPRGDLVDIADWGGEAQVHTTADTLFLTQTSQGWRIAAAGCQSRGEAPYACKVQGP
jgi:hypothetical protein